MIEILTLFAALVSGPQAVELAVAPEVDAVVVRLDGEEVANLEAPPWRLTVDLGPELAPHLLEAEARDGGGATLTTARRWVNRAPPAEATEAGEDDAAGAEAGTEVRAEVVIVLHRESQEAMVPVVEAYEKDVVDSVNFRTHGMPQVLLRLGEGIDVSLLWAETARRAEPSKRDLFAQSGFFPLGPAHPRGHGFSWALSHWWPEDVPPRLADAVAVAGRMASGAGRPGAVVLLILSGTPDGSLVSPGEARRFLRRLEVPLHVWTPAEEPGDLAATWGPVASVATGRQLRLEVEALRALLAGETDAQPEATAPAQPEPALPPGAAP